jgi:urease accessory protein
MLRATTVVRARRWQEANAVGRVTLPFDERHRRRIRMTDDQGRDFLLDLVDATRIEDGDGLVLETGDIVLVRAAAEDVLDIRGSDAIATARIAWHLGNRHTPVQMLASGALRIAYEHVLDHMARQMGAHTLRSQAPFAPEGGAYSEIASTHGGDHGHHH